MAVTVSSRTALSSHPPFLHVPLVLSLRLHDINGRENGRSIAMLCAQFRHRQRAEKTRNLIFSRRFVGCIHPFTSDCIGRICIYVDSSRLPLPRTCNSTPAPGNLKLIEK
ncbi:hypothetical protein AB1N83_012975 [Pleurotus pulmonarius]